MTITNIIEIKKLKKTYLLGKIKVHALKGINLRIKKGEFVALMGPSGSGKSTLLNMIGMLDYPTSGQILIDGIDISKMDENTRADFRLKKIGYVFQFFSLFHELTALENVILPMMIKGERNYRHKAMELLNSVGLAERANHKPAELSGGQQQRVSIARALANDPSMLLADEPTANLDSKSSEQIVDLLKNLNKERGLTIIMVTHELNLGEKADRIIWLKDGKIEKPLSYP